MQRAGRDRDLVAPRFGRCCEFLSMGKRFKIAVAGKTNFELGRTSEGGLRKAWAKWKASTKSREIQDEIVPCLCLLANQMRKRLRRLLKP
jgi:hypothetical protein